MKKVAPDPKIRLYSFAWRKPDEQYKTVVMESGNRRVEMTISPTGRNVQVFVDGKKIPK